MGFEDFVDQQVLVVVQDRRYVVMRRENVSCSLYLVATLRGRKGCFVYQQQVVIKLCTVLYSPLFHDGLNVCTGISGLQ